MNASVESTAVHGRHLHTVDLSNNQIRDEGLPGIMGPAGCWDLRDTLRIFEASQILKPFPREHWEHLENLEKVSNHTGFMSSKNDLRSWLGQHVCVYDVILDFIGKQEGHQSLKR